MTLPFWKSTPLHLLTAAQWESLCDGCGICCLQKFQDQDSGKISYTAIACRYLNVDRCRCNVYSQRQLKNPRCITLTPFNVEQMHWLPDTCAYRLVATGKDLRHWHPLLSGSRDTVHEAGVSVRDKVISGTHVHPDDLKWFF